MNIVSRHVSAPRGAELSCKGWPQEAALRMLMNNLDPEVAERPEDLVVYGGSGRAARSRLSPAGDSTSGVMSSTTPERSRSPPSASTSPGRSAPARPNRTSFMVET